MSRPIPCKNFLTRSASSRLGPRLRPLLPLNPPISAPKVQKERIRPYSSVELESRITSVPETLRLKLPAPTLMASELRSRIPQKATSLALKDLALSIFDIFLDAIYMCSGPNADKAYEVMLESWQTAFADGGADRATKQRFMEYKDTVIHIMINRADYDAYKRILVPTLKAGRTVSGVELVMKTFKFQRDKTLNAVIISNRAIDFFNSPRTPTYEKHKMLAIWLRKTLLYSGDTTDLGDTLSKFLDFAQAIGPINFRTTDPHLHLYYKAFRLLAAPKKKNMYYTPLMKMKKIFQIHTTFNEFNEFLTCLMEANVSEDSKATTIAWRMKSDLSLQNNLDTRTSKDLTLLMQAYLNLREYPKILSVHLQFPNLHDDSQIEILLKMYAQTKDWKALQEHFEGMYGMGDLPRLVHYTIVMEALVSMGARQEIEQLMTQLHLRNLKPNVFMYGSLIRSALNENDSEAVTKYFEEFSKQVKSQKIPNVQVAKLQPLRLEAIAKTADRQTMISAVLATLDESLDPSSSLHKEEVILTALKYSASLYSLELFEKSYQAACKLDLFTDNVCFASITFLTKMGLYERAETMALEAHQNSDVPYQNSRIFSAQLKNLRVWAAETPDNIFKHRLYAEIGVIMRQVNAGQASRNDIEELMTECAKYELSTSEPAAAERYLVSIQRPKDLVERHYLPLFRYYDNSLNHDSSKKILELYGALVKKNTTISAQLYFYVIKALVKLEGNEATSDNAIGLLKPVMNMYGLTKKGAENKLITSMELTKQAASIVQILKHCLTSFGANDKTTSQFVNKALENLQSKLGKDINIEYRRELYHRLAEICFANGYPATAVGILDAAMFEYHEIWRLMPLTQKRPKLLLIRYSEAIELKVKLLRALRMPTSDYEAILEDLNKMHVPIPRPVMDLLFERVIGSSMSAEAFQIVMGAVENFLVQGSMADIRLSRLISNVYRRYICYMLERNSALDLNQRFKAFNHLYGVDAETVRSLLAPVSDQRQALIQELLKLPKSVTVPFETLVSHPSHLFVPFRASWQINSLNPLHATKLVQLLEHFCEDNKPLSYSLYEQYPETFEYLLLFRDEKYRLTAFQEEVYKLSGGYERGLREHRQEVIDLMDAHCR